MLLPGGTHGSQYLLEGPRNLTVAPESYLHLACRIDNRKGECSWIKDGFYVEFRSGKYVYEKQPDDGDCSLLIFNASLHLDDGLWECQIARSSPEDGILKSNKARVSITAKPMSPSLIFDDKEKQDGEKVNVIINILQTFRCIVKKANPPAFVVWKLDGEGIKQDYGNISLPDEENTKFHTTTAQLHLMIEKHFSNKVLTCEAYHLSYENGRSVVGIVLDVQYSPNATISIDTGSASEVIMEGMNITMSCLAESNPPSTFAWYRDRGTNDNDYKFFAYTINNITLRDVKSWQSALYICIASNSIGESVSAKRIDVKCKLKFKYLNFIKLNTLIFITD
ncbi:Irregular chiasm C-roughest protein [Nymphon striatum]|nr:Irregular chiasm C-roughest protein [Nymphon striatum]